jgi:hypothetical protein
MAIPQPIDLTGSDQASLNADGGEQFNELHRRRHGVAKDGRSGLRGSGR